MSLKIQMCISHLEYTISGYTPELKVQKAVQNYEKYHYLYYYSLGGHGDMRTVSQRCHDLIATFVDLFATRGYSDHCHSAIHVEKTCHVGQKGGIAKGGIQSTFATETFGTIFFYVSA